MKLEKAIEVMVNWKKGEELYNSEELDEADRLLLEAGKAIELTRQDHSLGRIVLLKGETIE